MGATLYLAAETNLPVGEPQQNTTELTPVRNLLYGKQATYGMQKEFSTSL